MTGQVAVSVNGDGARAALRFSHPTGNIITAEIIAGLGNGLRSLAPNPHLKLITIEAGGADFSYGASIPEHAPDRIRHVLPAMHRLIEDLLAAPAVTAAVVRGRCLGGGFELALACDVIFAADDAVFGLPEIALAAFPPAAAALLPFRAGGARATRSILTGEPRPAPHWHEAGLLEAVVPAAALDEEVNRWFTQHLAGRSAVALRHAAAAARLSLTTHVRRILPELERLYLGRLMQTADAAEGVSAFLEKRPPRWTDR